MTYAYFAYGLTLSTPFPCDALLPATPNAAPDIIVTDGEVPIHLEAPVAEGKNWEAAPQRYLFRGGMRVGRFLVEDGNRVTLQRAPQSEDHLLALSFLDSVIVALLRQRGKLVLHANAALTPNGAIAFSGESGAGKSTTLTALLQQGCAMLADDIVALQLNAEGQVEVLLGVPQMNLLDDAAQSLNYDVSAFPRHQWRHGKSIVATHAQMAERPAPLTALYLLEKYEGEEVRVEALLGMEKFLAAQACVYGPMLPEEHPAAFPLFSALVEQIPVYRLQRPLKRWSIADVTRVMVGMDDSAS